MALTAERLAGFVAAWRAQQPAPASLIDRIASFVEHWRALDRTAAEKQASVEPPRLTAARLSPILAALSPVLAEARANGSSFSLWRMAGLDRRELRNTKALAMLLDPRGAHGLGDAPLAGLFDSLQPGGCPIPADLARCRVRAEENPFGDLKNRIDLIVDHPELLVLVEAKIDSGEGQDQLRRYAREAERMAAFRDCPEWRVVYLTTRPAFGLTYPAVPLLWRSLADAIAGRLADRPLDADRRAPIGQLLRHFATL